LKVILAKVPPSSLQFPFLRNRPKINGQPKSNWSIIKHMAKTILIIEDVDFLLGMEAKKMATVGYNVLTAINSANAFEILNNDKNLVDLILLDLLLPDVDGFAILEMIREHPVYGKVPVIIFSNIYEDKDIKRANALGVNQFLIKSNFTLDELVEKITTLIK